MDDPQRGTVPIKRLFIDIETAPYEAYIWRTGKQFVGHDSLRYAHRDGNIICVCYKWSHRKAVGSLRWDKEGDKNLVKDLLPVLLEADEIVAQNGDRFDIPFINTRILTHRLQAGPIWKTVDTLAIARKRFNFPSNRLDALGKFILGEGKIHTTFEMWKRIKENDDPAAMEKMVRYCRKDVVLLERVYNELAAFHGGKTHIGVSMGRDKWSCAACGSESVGKSKTKYTAQGTTQHQMQCRDCGKYYTISDSTYGKYQASKKKKQGGSK